MNYACISNYNNLLPINFPNINIEDIRPTVKLHKIIIHNNSQTYMNMSFIYTTTIIII